MKSMKYVINTFDSKRMLPKAFFFLHCIFFTNILQVVLFYFDKLIDIKISTWSVEIKDELLVL